MADFHIAQYNIARMRAPLEDLIMAGFVSRLDELNHLGDRTPGFVWRHQEADGTSTSVRPYEDERIIINLTVWESIEALHEFTYRSDHGPVYAARHTWFEPMDGPTLVLWWVTAGHRPDVAEAKARLDLLQQHGPSPEAFTMKRRFPPPVAAAR
ncbi:MAG: DUF3291 domain-containing protein [Dehalococcoidia bacterium]